MTEVYRELLTSFFVLYAVYCAVRPNWYGRVTSFFRGVDIADAALMARLQNAQQRRQISENLPPISGYMIALASLMCAGVTFFGLLLPQVMFGVLCLSIAVVFGLGYLRLRSTLTTRSATLAKRQRIVPAWVFVLVFACVLSLVAFTSQAQLVGSAIILMLSSLLSLTVAWAVSDMPAVLTGRDNVVELYVDERIRRGRVLQMVLLAVVPSFMFASFADGVDFHSGIPGAVARWFTSAVFMALLLYSGRLPRRNPTSADLHGWAQNPPEDAPSIDGAVSC